MIVWAAVAVAAGTAAGFGRPNLALPFAVVAPAALGVAALLRGPGPDRVAAALLALCAASGASAAWRSASAADAILPKLATERAVARACGTVRATRSRSVEIAARQVRSRGRTWHTREALRVSGRDATRLRVGERICASGSVLPPRPGRAEAPLLAADWIDRHGTGSVVRLAAADVRRRFAITARHALPRTQAGLLLGMTDGDTDLLDERTIEAFRTTGLAHLVAVSGANVAVLLVVVVLLTRALIPRGRWLRAVAAVPPLVFFAFLTGLEASVLRAVITAGVALALTAEGRTADALRLAALAFVVLVLATPDVLFRPGFQLSFGATLGIVLWASPLTERIQRFLPDGRVWRGLAIGAATTATAQGAVAPILAWHFGRIPAFGGVANLVAVPIAPFVTVGGLITLSLSSVVPFVEWTPALMRAPLDLILLVARTFARLPASSVGADLGVGLAITGLVVAVVVRSKRVRIAAIGIAIVAATASAGHAAARPNCSSGVAVEALDVGQGTSVLIRAEGHAILADAGPRDGGTLAKVKESGVSRLDAIVVSHQHVDHMEGAYAILETIEVGRVVVPPSIHWGRGNELVRVAAREHVAVVEAAAGDAFDAGPIHVDVLSPESGPIPTFSEDLVDPYSLVLRVRVGETTVVLPGDIRAEQQSLIAAQEELSAPVLVAPHHGSRNLDPKFVDAVDPKLTLITVGANNPYGLPVPESVRIFRRHGAVFRTDQNGRVIVCLGRKDAQVWTRQRR